MHRLSYLLAPCLLTPALATPLWAQSELTIYPARRVLTMDESLPEAEAVAVQHGRIIAVGSMESMEPWTQGREHPIDRRFEEKILLPGRASKRTSSSELLPTSRFSCQPGCRS